MMIKDQLYSHEMQLLKLNQLIQRSY